MKKLTLLLITGLCFSVSVGAQTLQEKKEIERAKAFVKSKGLTWGGQGDYGTKGLYTYDQSNSRYYGKAYFGIGGNQVQQSAPVRKPKERIPGWFKLPVPVAADPGTLKKLRVPGSQIIKKLNPAVNPAKYLNPINDESQKKKVRQPKKKQASNIRRIRGFQPKTKKPVASNKLINTGANNTIQPVGSNKLEKPKTKKPVASNKLINTGANNTIQPVGSNKLEKPKTKKPVASNKLINTGANNTIQPVGSNKLEKPKTKKPVAKQSSRKVRSPEKKKVRQPKALPLPKLNLKDTRRLLKRRLELANGIDNTAKRVSDNLRKREFNKADENDLMLIRDLVQTLNELNKSVNKQ
jgi:hypothetical protein